MLQPLALLIVVALILPSSLLAQNPAPASTPPKVQSVWRVQEVMIPMRDGIRLQTAIVRRTDQSQSLPILLERTPYGVPEQQEFDEMAGKNGADWTPPSWKELAADGYILVFQNLRGRFKSEGTFLLSSQYDPAKPNETNDAYDTIEWLVKNVPNNNGKVGIYGVSYDGLTAGLTLLHPHPALKAVSEQASPVDQWMNDDMHRYGALRESYAFEYSVLEQADKNQNTHFDFDLYDTYDWYLRLGPLSEGNASYLHGSIPYWNEMMQHPDYDEFWKKEAWVNQLHSSPVPNLNVAGFWDQEDPWGPWQIFRHADENGVSATNLMVAGPWFHGEWQSPEGDRIGLVPFGGHKTALEFRQNIEAPFFRYYLHGEGDAPKWKATTFQTGSNTWHEYAAWPPANSTPTSLYLHCDGMLSFEPPTGNGPNYRQYVSDPGNPVPYRTRPISPTYPRPEWRTWEVADQRFAENRPDVLTWESTPLDRDVIVTGQLAAKLYASSSGTDSDFVVKLIDVYPESGQKSAEQATPEKPLPYAESLNGYELPIAMEVRRGRYLRSFESAQPLVANKPVVWNIPLRDHDHVFLKGHRIMVQVQSTWFPVIDRNPQKFVPSIYKAAAADYVPATQRVYCSSQMPSQIVLPVAKQ
ncbi:MAG TPA: CocE/NonD family hydrolase [Bryobacteraceae bacterium]|nr:CocE/NonD family hydrolase [Bryobacteraceae bacterium]